MSTEYNPDRNLESHNQAAIEMTSSLHKCDQEKVIDSLSHECYFLNKREQNIQEQIQKLNTSNPSQYQAVQKLMASPH